MGPQVGSSLGHSMMLPEAMVVRSDLLIQGFGGSSTVFSGGGNEVLKFNGFGR